jgi:pyruvate/2-oxoglutarate dehydrogenase complex dihydrolipoamide dehydrogenase (E3) component
MEKSEILIIGFGKAGKTVAAKCAALGKSVILFEEDPKMYGGTCINVACIPTKALVHQAELSFLLGGSFAEKSLRYKQAVEKKDALTSSLRNKNYHKLADDPHIKVVDGKASFLDPHHVEANGVTYEGKAILINTGSRPFVPEIPGIHSSHIYVSETLLGLTDLPRRLTIIGGGYIGLEFASLFLNFGSEVTLVQAEDAFMGREDEEIASAVEKDFLAHGLHLYKSAKTLSFTEKDGEVTTRISVSAQEKDLVSEAVLVATGRRPNVEALLLEKAGVALTMRGAVQVNERLETNVPGIYAAGDVAGGLQFTYMSLDDSRIILSDLLGGSRTSQNRGVIPYSVFLDPAFSRVGLTEKEARLSHEVLVGKIPTAAIPKAHILEKPQGLLKVVVDAKNHEILGAHLYCAESYEMINLLKLAMDAHLPYEVLRDGIYTHPTMSEGFNDLFASVK